MSYFHPRRNLDPYQGQNEISEQMAVRPAGEGRQSDALGKAESRKQVRSEKSCVIGGESPSSLEAELPEFRTKVMNGKV
jgi:hypothetical protein